MTVFVEALTGIADTILLYMIYSAFFDKKDSYNKDAKLVRGIFTGFIGTTGKLADNCIYNIRIKNYYFWEMHMKN